MIHGENVSFPILPGTVHTIQPSMFTRANFVFTGWNTLPSGLGQSFIPGESQVFNNSIRLYAQWAPINVPGVIPPAQTPTPTPTPAAPPSPSPTPPVDVEPTPGPTDWAPASEIFIDVPLGAWYHDYITIVFNHGLFQGTSEGMFEPHINMSRAMFAQVIANLEGIDLTAFAASSPTFADTTAAHWGFAAIQWAVSEGIIQGMGDGSFAPDAPVTREQMATMLHRYAQARGINLPQGASAPFADQGSISYWAATAVANIQAAGIVRGRDDGRFDPQATATRAEVAAIFARFLDITLDDVANTANNVNADANGYDDYDNGDN